MVLPIKIRIRAGKAVTFRDKAKNVGKRSFMLIENHNKNKEQDRMMDEYLPEILGYGFDHVAAYYYGRNCEDPNGNMETLMKHLKNFR